MTTDWEDAVASVRRGEEPRAAAAGLVGLMTLEERRGCLDGDLPFWVGLADMGTGGYHRRPFLALQVPRLGIPGFAFSDGPRGVVIGHATCFPVSMARGATWDLDLEERIGDAIGRELLVSGADLYGGVCVNLLRHPAWGRAQETYGEEPHHVGELGAALTRGVQRHVMATVKHFACNSMENARFRVDVAVEEAVLHEVYLPHFHRIVDEGVACVMSAYNAVNGEWCGQHTGLLTDVLRDEWGFEGFVISDWIFGLRDAGPSISAGLDVEMPAPMVRREGLDAALAEGSVTDADIDACVTRALAGMLRHASRPAATAPPVDIIGGSEHRALAREAAGKAIVLLRNEALNGHPILPLAAGDVSSIAVFGALADTRNLGDGGSSDVYPLTAVTPLEGLRAALPHATITHHTHADVDAAAAADLALVVVGYTRADEGEFIGDSGTSHLRALLPGPDDPDLVAAFEARVAAEPPDPVPADEAAAHGGFATGGDRTSLDLRPDDEALIHAVAALQPSTVVAVIAGSAVTMEHWRDDVAAIVVLWYPGMEGGHGLADVLLGVRDAGGRLPFSVPTDAAHLPSFDRDTDAVTYDRWHGHWRLARDGHAAAFPFGFGLSYTSWRLEEATAAADSGSITVRAVLANIGERRGTDVVQVYGGRPADSSRPPRRLLAFERVEVAPGGSTEVVLEIPWARLAVRDEGRWDVVAGTYELAVARHSEDPGAIVLAVERS